MTISARIWLAALLISRIAPPGAEARAGAIKAEVAISRMHCIRPTETGLGLGIGNDRDEVFIEPEGQGPAGSFKKRLPANDDYYEWKEDQKDAWTNKDQKPQPAPVIWTGTLAEGQAVDIMVRIREQDNDISIGSPGINQQRDRMSALVSDRFNADPLTRPLIGLLQDWIQRDRETIGVFTVSLKNEGGKLVQTYHSSLFTSIAEGGKTPEESKGYQELKKGSDVGLYQETRRLMDKAVTTPEVSIQARGTNDCKYDLIVVARPLP